MTDSNKYFKGYIKAITDSPWQLLKTFDKEVKFLDEILKRYSYCSSFLDVGCGNGRTIFRLNSITTQKLLVGMDNNYRMTRLANKKMKNEPKDNSIYFIERDIMKGPNDGLLAVEYDIVYSGYNLIGSIDYVDREDFNSRSFFIGQKKDLVRDNGLIITTSWKQSDETTKFLKEYYRYIGHKDVDVSKDKSVVDDMIFYRISIDEMVELYRKNDLKNIEVHDLGLWNTVAGKKKLWYDRE